MLYKTIGLGALKYFILKVDPKKRILFNPEESIDFHGNTGPFIQYTFARIQSLLRKGAELNYKKSGVAASMSKEEKELIKTLVKIPSVIEEAALNQSPAVVANFVYDLVKSFNYFYQNHSILHLEDEGLIAYRLDLSSKVSEAISNCLGLLGIESPERM